MYLNTLVYGIFFYMTNLQYAEDWREKNIDVKFYNKGERSSLLTT